MDAAPTTLRELFDELIAEAGGESTPGDTAEYLRDGQAFAVAEADAVEVRLHPEIAEAARRTPATAASSRGPEWVRFAPPELDQHALDRAEAWFLSAWRAANRAER